MKFEGAKAYKDRRLQKEIKSAANGALDERQIKDDAQKICEFYQKAGYNQAQVTYNIDRNRSTGFGTVTFKIREGVRVKIAAINFIGNDHIDPLFEATVQAAEEAIVNAMIAAKDMCGEGGHCAKAIPHAELVALLRRFGRYQPPH